MYELIKEYTEIFGPVGFEDEVAARMRADWQPICERVWSNRIGNVLAKVGGKGKKLLITAHLDEINFLVKSVSDEGFLWLSTGSSGTEPVTPPNDAFIGQPALVKGREGLVPGRIATTTGHVRSGPQRESKSPAWNDIFVDLGLSGRDEVEALGIRPGSPVVYSAQTRRMGRRIEGKAMDDRVGLALMTTLARQLRGQQLAYELYFAATVQEEIGLGGSLNLFREADFDLAIALEIGLVGDIPTVEPRYMPTALGKGPIVTHRDAQIHYSESVSDKLIDAAKRAGQPLQHAIFHSFATDGVQLIRAGIPTALFTFPTRYTHSPYEMVDEFDLKAMAEILRAFVLGS